MSAVDRTLVKAMLAGDQGAFDGFFDANFAGLYRFALARLGYDEDAAEEVAQATLCKAVSKLATYRGEAALFTWLCTFCRREIADYCRRNRVLANRVELREEVPAVRAALESNLAAIDGPARALERAELGRLVHVALDSLPSHYGRILEWKYLERLSVKEIAARLELTPKAAESLLTRARQAFKDGYRALTSAPLGDAATERP